MRSLDFFELPESMPFRDQFEPEGSLIDWLMTIEDALAGFDFISNESFRENLPVGFVVGKDVYIHPTVKLPPYGSIEGPAWIGPHTEIRPGAYVRSNVIIGSHCVIGNSCEYKNCLLMDKVQTPHYNYVGDSILGNGAHLAAGAILANLRLDRKSVTIRYLGDSYPTGLRKVGSFIGDGAEVGCNAVLQPGTILGKKSIVMPIIAFGGYLPEGEVAYEAAQGRFK